MARTPADVLGDEQGAALVVVVLLSFILLGATVLVLGHGSQAERTSARDRNFDVALSIAEAGIHEGMAKIDASGGSYSGSISGTTPEGSYTGTVTRIPGERYEIDVTGTTPGDQLDRARRVRVHLEPPESFPFALQSETSIELKNNDVVSGGVWANESISVDEQDEIYGPVTAAQSWIEMKQGSLVEGDVQSGGFKASGPFALKLANNARIVGDALASVSDPSTTCPDSHYKVPLGNGSEITGDLTTCGSKEGSGGSIGGTYTPGKYTQAPPRKGLPTFTFNPNNYDPATYHEFTSAADFQTWLDSNGTAVQGTFYVDEPSPSQTNRIDLTGTTVVGDTTIVTDAPVFTNGIDDGPGEQVFVLVSHYDPPDDSACSVNHDSSECAVHIKNSFDPSCRTAVLVYADLGPVAVKNNQDMCGSIVAESILIKNNQALTYDDRIARVIGFGSPTYEVSVWEELDPS